MVRISQLSNGTRLSIYLPTVSDVVISIDTRHAAVAHAAIAAGADMVNDVSGGTFDDAMFSTVGALGVPMILMHMRGTPETMQSLTSYQDIVVDVGTSLKYQSDTAAKEHSIHKWMQIVDPGIGFAKDLRGNLLLLQNIAALRRIVEDLPVLIGTSRKGFLGTITSVPLAEDRDPGTLSSCITALCLENHGSVSETAPCSILRVHNVAPCRQAVAVMDAIRNVH
jgi:dihydropteroate synthase